MKRARTFLALVLAVLFIASMGATVANAADWGGIWASVMGGGDPDDINIKSQIDAIPAGGTEGQVLMRGAGGDYVTKWGDVYDWSSRVGSLESTVVDHSNMLRDHNRRIESLEETQWIIGLGVRISDTESGTLSAFADYSVNRSKFDRVGVRYEFKLGPSSEDRKIVKAIQRIQELEQENAILREEGTKKDERISSLEERVSALERVWLERN